MFGSRRKQVPPDGPFYKQRAWINSAAFLGFLVTMSLLALLTSGTDDQGADTTADSRDTSAPDPLAGVSGPLSPGDPQHLRHGPDGRPENCRTDDRDTSRPTAEPADMRWKKLGAIMVPSSPSAGPLRAEAGMWWCFARTPMGAVLAAHIIPVQMSGAAWRTVAEQQLVPGEPRDKFVADKATTDQTSQENSAIERFAGFSLSSYSRDTATVRLLIASPVGGYLSMSVSVRWRDGDWKVMPQDDGAPYSPAKQAAPSGFVMWGG
ncbi:hypothetical protein [Streptomyces sp. Inha503]|uniref:hypothetical protein n=1 Tax=Streptomyces sp. Inha503 TaxID=3383314 RepID=UPI0039A063D9